MSPESFAYWLQGYVEINGQTPTDAQWLIIKDHLAKVFDKKTPNRDNGVQQPVDLKWPKIVQDEVTPGWMPPRVIDWTKISHTHTGIPPAIC